MSNIDRKRIIKKLDELNLHRHFLTFLIDKWGGIAIDRHDPKSFYNALNEFYEHFNIPKE